MWKNNGKKIVRKVHGENVNAVVDPNGTVVVEYEYDAWDKEVYHDTHTDQENILYQYNALKYRGYYYDSDLGLYYLNSRFYDQEIGRFINTDTIDIISATAGTLTEKNLYAYCNNNPILFVDDTGEIAETIFDIVSLGGSMIQVAANPADPWAWASLAGDVVDMIPIVTGCGEAVKAIKLASETTDRLKTVGKVAKKWKVGDPIDALTQAGNIPTWNTVRQRFWKNMGKALEDVLDEDTLKRLNKGLAPLDEYRESIHLHHPNGREGAEEFFTFGPVRKIDHMDWHKKNGYRF